MSVAALTLGVGLAVVFATTLAFVMLLASVLLMLAAMALRTQRTRSLQDGPIAAGRAGHAWVAYDSWRRGR